MTALGLVVAQFYEELAAEMELEARDRIEGRDATVAETVHVPGVYDAPLAAAVDSAFPGHRLAGRTRVRYFTVVPWREARR